MTTLYSHPIVSTETTSAPSRTDRDPEQRALYLREALGHLPRLLSALDRNPLSPTFGCLDRQYWHYRTAAFPSQMYQEGVLPLALVWHHAWPQNRWHRQPRLRDWIVASLRFNAASTHRDGSCDDYYPYERALGAAVFSLCAASRAVELLELDDPLVRNWLALRAQWLVRHDESGHLANHQALAALGLLRTARILGDDSLITAGEQRLERVLNWQSSEGWFEEYGGADPGYQTVTIDSLAKIRQLTGDPLLDEPLRKAVAYSHWFLHPDGSYAGEYGSRGTYHYYPHGMELLAGHNAQAADLADGHLKCLAAGKQAALDDDRLLSHRLGNLLEAYEDWAPQRPSVHDENPLPATVWLPQAQQLVVRQRENLTIVSAARGGIIKHFSASGLPRTDAGLVVELADGRRGVTQGHDLQREVTLGESREGTTRPTLRVCGPVHAWRPRTATPLTQAVLHLGMITAGRFGRDLVRRLLQALLITSRRPLPVRLTRTIEFLPPKRRQSGQKVRITDVIELTDHTSTVRQMAFGSDHQTAYTAAASVYQESMLYPWMDLAAYVDQLNAERRVTIVRHW